MKLTSAQVERTLGQIQAQAIPDDHPVVPQLNDLFGEHTFFLDGKKLSSFKYKWVHKDGREAANAHILLNLSFGGKWAGRYGVDQTAFPQNFEIDYVRVYRRSAAPEAGSRLHHAVRTAQRWRMTALP